jgi:hypothetical protein
MALLNDRQKQVRQASTRQNTGSPAGVHQGEGGARECQMCHDNRQLIDGVAVVG